MLERVWSRRLVFTATMHNQSVQQYAEKTSDQSDSGCYYKKDVHWTGRRISHRTETFSGESHYIHSLLTGAIIEDGDRESWDPRGHMIWDNFSIFRTNCAILTSYIRAALRTCRGFSRVCCQVEWSKMVRVARVSCGIFTAKAGNKAGRKSQGSSMHFHALS